MGAKSSTNPVATFSTDGLSGGQTRRRNLDKQQASAIEAMERNFVFRYRSPEHLLEVFTTFYGPMLKAFAALDADGQAALRADLLALVDRFNRSGDGTVIVPSEYLEIVITRQ